MSPDDVSVAPFGVVPVAARWGEMAKTFQRVVVRQVDLDTCLTGLLLGATSVTPVTHAPTGASADDLADTSVLCLEAGGSGDADRGNFDHHDTTLDLAPACRQALARMLPASNSMRRLVDYVASVDVGLQAANAPPAFPSLSALFSGMRLLESDAVSQFRAGLAILGTVLEEDLDPWATMPDHPTWRAYVDRKRVETEALERDAARIELFETAGGRHAGFLQSGAMGAIGAIYQRGCAVAIAFNPAFERVPGAPPMRKFTIAGRLSVRVDGLLPTLRALESGWGGPSHGTIIASPPGGSDLSPEQVLDVVREGL